MDERGAMKCCFLDTTVTSLITAVAVPYTGSSRVQFQYGWETSS